MVKDKRGFDKEQFLTDLKQNDDLVTFVQSLSNEEIARIQEIRKFETLNPNTPRWKVALLCDPLRQQLNLAKSRLAKRLWTIKDLNNKINRLNIQLATNNITEKMADNITMNKPEVESLIQHSLWLSEGEFNAVRLVLADISGLIGHIDYVKKEILTMEQFDKIVEETELYLNKFGYKLFGELDG
jgi:hypothetical protein